MHSSNSLASALSKICLQGKDGEQLYPVLALALALLVVVVVVVLLLLLRGAAHSQVHSKSAYRAKIERIVVDQFLGSLSGYIETRILFQSNLNQGQVSSCILYSV